MCGWCGVTDDVIYVILCEFWLCVNNSLSISLAVWDNGCSLKPYHGEDEIMEGRIFKKKSREAEKSLEKKCYALLTDRQTPVRKPCDSYEPLYSFEFEISCSVFASIPTCESKAFTGFTCNRCSKIFWP